MSKKYIDDFKVLKNKSLNNDTILLELQHPEILPVIEAGQFVQFAVANEPSVFLRRPLSIHDVDYTNNTISLFIKIIGKGTRKMKQLTEGETVNLIYPLGNAFTLETHKKVLLAGGGCGIAPLLYLASKLHANSCDVHIILAGKTANDILRLETYNKYGKTYMTTEDGSLGEQGLIIQNSIFKKDFNSFDRVYTCGPERMMQAVSRIALSHNVACEVSLENTMACGVGACLCCVVDTQEGNKCVCVDGPVFNVKKLKW